MLEGLVSQGIATKDVHEVAQFLLEAYMKKKIVCLEILGINYL